MESEETCESHSVWSDDPSWMTLGWTSQIAQMGNFKKTNLTSSDGSCLSGEGTRGLGGARSVPCVHCCEGLATRIGS